MPTAMAAQGQGFLTPRPQPWPRPPLPLPPVDCCVHGHGHGRAYGGRSAPFHEEEAKRALHGGQAHGRRASFDADDTTACAGPLPALKEMKQTDEVLVGGTGE